MKLPPADATSVSYEMGYGADEFGNVLQGQFTGEKSVYSCETIGRHLWRIKQNDASFQIEVKVTEMPARKIALFSLPVLQVVFNIETSQTDLQQAFFARFFKYFHKGGG